MAPASDLHIASHRSLVQPGAPRPAVQPPMPDVVIVPATRRDGRLRHAAGVARMAGCPLVVLCSHDLSAADVPELLRGGGMPPWTLAVDIGHRYGEIPLRLKTDSIRVATFGRGNASRKRNLGLLLAKLMSWERILFLDDDVVGMDRAELHRTMTLLDGVAPDGASRMEAVGWAFTAFADNSVVCHARRVSGEFQDTFIGGGGLAVRMRPDVPFFPNVYNEDWLFLFDAVARRRVVLAGELTQVPYDPFDNTERAAKQEFGDLLAEALFRVLHETPAPRAGADDAWLAAVMKRVSEFTWWDDEVARRRRFIRRTREDLRRSRNGLAAMFASLDRAERTIQDSWCWELADFVAAWRADLATWRETLDELKPLGRGDDANTQPWAEKAFGMLGASAIIAISGQ